MTSEQARKPIPGNRLAPGGWISMAGAITAMHFTGMHDANGSRDWPRTSCRRPCSRLFSRVIGFRPVLGSDLAFLHPAAQDRRSSAAQNGEPARTWPGMNEL